MALDAIIVDFWVRVKVEVYGAVVITRSCCAEKAGLKAIEIVAKHGQINAEYTAFPEAIRSDLLLPDSSRDRVLSAVEAKSLVALLSVQADQTPN